MLGRAKCKILKEIRQKIADENDIPYVTRECTYQGDCSGTCPRCESELRYLERELQLRESVGRSVAVTALCTGIALGTAACNGPGPGQDLGGAPAEADPKPVEQPEELAGMPEEEPPTEIDELAGDVEDPNIQDPWDDDDQICGYMEDSVIEGSLNTDPVIMEQDQELAGAPEDPGDYYEPSNEELDKEEIEKLDAFDVFASTYNIETITDEAALYPEFTAEEDINLRAVTTYHWNGGQGARPEHLHIYDITDGEVYLLGTWPATGRGGSGATDVNWDFFPDLELKAGHTYRFADSAPDTWSSNRGSDGTGFIELRTDKDKTVTGVITGGSLIGPSEEEN